MKKDYRKFKSWFEKKDILYIFICNKFNMINVNHNTLTLIYN